LILVMGAIAYGAFTDLRSTREATTALAHSERVVGTDAGPPIVAVLPFAAEGAGGDSQFFADGIHDDLLAQLSRLGSLRVISRSSVQGYRDTDQSAESIGQALGAGMIVEGVVRVLGSQLRMTAQLVDARSGALLWADSYDRPLDTTSLFGVQSEIAETIASRIGAELTPEESLQLALIPTDSMAAYRAYRTATSEFGGAMTKPEFSEQLERALELDPDFVQPMAELVGVYALRATRPTKDTEAQIERAETLIDRLQDLAPGSVELLYAQAYYVYYVLKDYSRALALTDRALEKSPSNLRLLQLKSFIQNRAGDLDGRAATLRRMMVLDPMETSFRHRLLSTLYLQHRYDEVWAQMEPSDALDDGLAFNYAVLASRQQETIEARLRAIEDIIGSRESANPWHRFLIPFIRRDFAQALAVAEGVVDPPHWPDRPLEGRDSFEVLVHWAAGNEEALQKLLMKARARAATLLEADPALAGDYFYRKSLVGLDALEGKVEATVRGVRELERESRDDLAIRMGDLSEYCSMYAMVGQAAEAVSCLRTALTEPSMTEPFLEPWLPLYDPVRASPEFQALLAEL
jgi:TolB-like protein/tetratricopeptide (TPR) repeat protein